eukprot:CAMPEP_0115867404 /NCGR_PEP_ID=MMETSP0287-20121206/20751_1 /TAXON_ID=412157 /ORGANISM="Chrysochromulina rotalis, Strain UIO044" /LENGTH=100 /DNA_ID=CAMNT_0003322009 /DNA_START=323 /DNA_END=626 /DNA_ORIENTATION=-
MPFKLHNGPLACACRPLKSVTATSKNQVFPMPQGTHMLLDNRVDMIMCKRAAWAFHAYLSRGVGPLMCVYESLADTLLATARSQNAAAFAPGSGTLARTS